jgi:hypothetical protein
MPVPAYPRYYDWQYWRKLYDGCALYNAHAKWGHNTATPVLDGGERAVATNANVRFLDLVHGFAGHELRAKGISASQRWYEA